MITVFGVTGIPELDDAFVNLKRKMDLAIVRAAQAGGNQFKRAWKEEIASRNWKPGPDHKMDPRNVPPHQFYDSIIVDEPIRTPGSVFIEIYSDIEKREGQGHAYTAYQEYGFTGKNGKFIINPTMTPAYDKNKDAVVALIMARIGEAALVNFPARFGPTILRYMSLSQVKTGSGENILGKLSGFSGTAIE